MKFKRAKILLIFLLSIGVLFFSSDFGLIDIDGAELWHYFPEMLSRAGDCRFYNCTHTHEPGCAVEQAVKDGEIAWSRYESYLKILDEDEKYRK